VSQSTTTKHSQIEIREMETVSYFARPCKRAIWHGMDASAHPSCYRDSIISARVWKDVMKYSHRSVTVVSLGTKDGDERSVHRYVLVRNVSLSIGETGSTIAVDV
jgi:hypothetical protein